MLEAFFAEWQMWTTLAIIAVAIVLYSLDRLSMELVSAAVLVALLVLFQIAPVPEEQTAKNALDAGALLRGFASPALFAIMGLMIIGQGMFQSAALDYPTRFLVKTHGKYPLPVMMLIFVFVMVVSAFLNNTPVVVMFIPIMAAIASQSKVPASKFMMPLSFVSIFGGMTTVIGSSTNLLAVDAFESQTGMKIDFFALAPIGLVLAAVGITFITLSSKWLLPSREGETLKSSSAQGKQFIAQIELTRGHPMIGQGATAGLFPDLPDMTVRMVQRKEDAFLPPFDDITFRLHDTIIVATTRKALTNLLRSKPDILAGVLSEVDIRDDTEASGELTMVEAIVAPGSRIIGRSISQIGFRYQTNCVIVGIQRRSKMIRADMSSIRLEAGDVLLILGDRTDIRSLRSDRDIVILEYSMAVLPDAAKSSRAALIFAIVVGTAALGLLPIAVSAIAGATLMVATGCLNIRQASRAVDLRIFLLIGSALAMGLALEKTGGAEYIAGAFVGLSQSGSPVKIMSVLFIITAITTNVLSNNATAVLFTPVAISAASQIGIDPMVLVMTVIFGANCSFATPIGYQTNLLVMAPGHYKFKDFIIIGIPLIILMWIVYTIIAPIYFTSIGLL
ncbi:MAG: SLC13 family permease [Parvularculaceae bacterium]